MVRQVDLKALVSHIVKGDGGDKCRICMGETTDGQVFLGDTVMMDGEKHVTLAELLENITGVQIYEDDVQPEGVCIGCTSAAVSAQELKVLVKNSQELWTKTVNALFYIPSTMESQVKAMYAYITKDDLNLSIVKSKPDLTERGTTVNRMKNKLLKGSKGNRRYLRTGQQCKCVDCGKPFPSPFHLSVHLKNSGQKAVCLHCGAVKGRGRELKKHLLEVHQETCYMCQICRNLFLRLSDLELHEKKSHSNGALTCTDCGRTFPRLGTFEAHSQMHAVRTCRTCGSQFSNRGCYREHRSQCEPDAKPVAGMLPRSKRANIRDPATYTCDYCGKTYSSRPQLQNHIVWIHMDVRPHQCQWCGKRFYTLARLNEHSVVHTKERNFACDICGMKLVSKMAAVYHRRRHTGEKPYECEDCGERFISSSRRTEHAKRRHGRGVRMQCSYCPASFVRSLELRKHVDRQHSKISQKIVFME